MWTLSTSKFSLCDKYGENGVHSVEVPSSATSCYVIVYMYKRWTSPFFWLRNRQNLTMILYYSEILLSKTKAANFALSFFFQGGCHQRSVYWLLFNGGVQKVSSIELKSIWGCSLLLLHCRESEHPMILVCTYIVIKLCVSKVQRHMHFSGVIYGSIY
jgi:hypothetical protein